MSATRRLNSGPRCVKIAGPKAGLNVNERDMTIERCHRRGHYRRGITLSNDTMRSAPE